MEQHQDVQTALPEYHSVAPSEDVGEEYHERDQNHGADHDDQPIGAHLAYMGSAATEVAAARLPSRCAALGVLDPL